jgi:sortase (surface protein transpeptidase)
MTDRSTDSQPSARLPGRWLYLFPVCLLLMAGWTWRDYTTPATESYEFADQGFPLEPATDENDPRRYIAVEDGFVEDAATGVRLPAVAGLTPAEVFADSKYRPSESGAPWPGSSVPGSSQYRSRIPTVVDDLRYGIGPRPAGVKVDSIGVKTWVVAIGLDPNRALRVPNRADIIGWWSGGSVPGEVGPTVLVGHFDSKTRAGVFAKLEDAKLGELIEVSQTDGSKYTYFVTDVEKLRKTAFPTKKVYGWTPESTLRLVTCGGKFDRRTGHYEENTIVYAELLSFIPGPRPTTTLAPPLVAVEGTSISTVTSTSSPAVPVTKVGRPIQPVEGIPVPSGSTPSGSMPSGPTSTPAASSSSVPAPTTSAGSIPTSAIAATAVPAMTVPATTVPTTAPTTALPPIDSSTSVAPPPPNDPTIPEASVTVPAPLG